MPRMVMSIDELPHIVPSTAKDIEANPIDMPSHP